MSVMTDLKPFPVVHGSHTFHFTPAEEGRFYVTCEDVEGVNAQGDTFEQALECAISMAAFAEQCLRDIQSEKRNG